MDRYYYEYTISLSAFLEEVESFLMDRFYNGIEESEEGLILRSDKPLDNIIKELKEYVKSLEALFGVKIDLDIKKEKKANIDWIESYRKSITPVEVESFYIHPGWYEPKEGKINIQIDPALAFGSGHHETTRGCLVAIDKLVQNGQTLLDVGCGSGILAIAAAKKGAIVDICDTDALAIEQAQKNFALNGVKYHNSWIGSAGNAKRKYDIVIANIVADILILIAPELKRATKKWLILSGIIQKYRPDVEAKFSDFVLEEAIEDGEWVTLILRKGDYGESEEA